MEKLPEEFNLHEIQSKVPPEELTPYVIVAFQECERMNMLTNEIKRTLKELNLGLKVQVTLSLFSFYVPFSVLAQVGRFPHNLSFPSFSGNVEENKKQHVACSKNETTTHHLA